MVFAQYSCSILLFIAICYNAHQINIIDQHFTNSLIKEIQKDKSFDNLPNDAYQTLNRIITGSRIIIAMLGFSYVMWITKQFYQTLFNFQTAKFGITLGIIFVIGLNECFKHMEKLTNNEKSDNHEKKS